MFKPPTDAYFTEVVTRYAPRWTWDIVDLVLGDPNGRSKSSYFPGSPREAALNAMCEAGAVESDLA